MPIKLDDKTSLGSNVIKNLILNWKVVVAVAIGIIIPPLLPVFIGIGIYLILKEL